MSKVNRRHVLRGLASLSILPTGALLTAGSAIASSSDSPAPAAPDRDLELHSSGVFEPEPSSWRPESGLPSVIATDCSEIVNEYHWAPMGEHMRPDPVEEPDAFIVVLDDHMGAAIDARAERLGLEREEVLARVLRSAVEAK